MTQFAFHDLTFCKYAYLVANAFHPTILLRWRVCHPPIFFAKIWNATQRFLLSWEHIFQTTRSKVYIIKCNHQQDKDSSQMYCQKNHLAWFVCYIPVSLVIYLSLLGTQKMDTNPHIQWEKLTYSRSLSTLPQQDMIPLHLQCLVIFLYPYTISIYKVSSSCRASEVHSSCGFHIL